MRIIIHDFAGHPPQFLLAQELAKRRHKVLYLYAADIHGPRADFKNVGREENSPAVVALYVRTKDKYSYLGRLVGQRRYAREFTSAIREFQPDWVLSANSPTDVQITAVRFCRKNHIRFLHWVTDFYSLALQTLLSRRWGRAGRLLARPFYSMEKSVFRKSDAVIYISEGFREYARSQDFNCNQSEVIPTWASIADIRVTCKENPWSLRHGIGSRFVFLYCGTMGLKHNPQVVLRMAQSFAHDQNVAIVVVSEGIGRTYLEDQKRALGLANLLLFDFQVYSELSDLLGAADVLFATLEADSGAFSVPSKVLSYCCAGRPILLLAPSANAIVRVVEEARAGLCFDDAESFVAAAQELRNNSEIRSRFGRNARAYAEATFDIGKIADQFLEIMTAPKPKETEVAISRGA